MGEIKHAVCLGEHDPIPPVIDQGLSRREECHIALDRRYVRYCELGKQRGRRDLVVRLHVLGVNSLGERAAAVVGDSGEGHRLDQIQQQAAFCSGTCPAVHGKVIEHRIFDALRLAVARADPQLRRSLCQWKTRSANA